MANQTTVTNILPIGVEKILVQSNDKSKSVDLNSGGFVSLEYSESILHDTIKASVQFVDTGDTQGIDNKNVLEGLPLVGQEKVTLKFKDNNDNTLGDIDMYVNAVTPMGEDTRKMLVVLDLVSKEYILNEKIRLRKRFDGPISTSIDKILTEKLPDGLQSEKKLDIEETFGEYNFIGNNRKSYYTINWLSKKAVSSENQKYGKSAGYLFFETSEGFHFKSIDGLCSQKPKKRIIYNETNELPFEYDTKAIYYSKDNLNEAQTKLRMGTFSSRVILFNPFDCTYEVVENELSEYEKDLKTAGKNFPKTNDEFNIPGKEKEFSRTTYYLKDVGSTPSGDTNQQIEKSDTENFEYKNILNQSIMRYNQFLTFTADITIPADYSLHAGDVIHLDVPLLEVGQTKDTSRMDGGLYIISDVTHRVTPQETTTRLGLVRDTSGKKRQE